MLDCDKTLSEYLGEEATKEVRRRMMSFAHR